MTLDEAERLEQTAFSMVVQAMTDYRNQAVTIFAEETDLPQDIAEDLTRESIEAMGLPGLQERLYGKVDVKKAVYVFLPEPHPVTLMLDAKAEKADDRTATIQMSQTSMTVKMKRSGHIINEQGRLEQEIRRGDRVFYVVTVIAKFRYHETAGGKRKLENIVVACIPNGKLQNIYNPTPDDTIWQAGRDAPTLGEDFRVRLSYPLLTEKAPWRVREIDLSR